MLKVSQLPVTKMAWRKLRLRLYLHPAYRLDFQQRTLTIFDNGDGRHLEQPALPP